MIIRIHVCPYMIMKEEERRMEEKKSGQSINRPALLDASASDDAFRFL